MKIDFGTAGYIEVKKSTESGKVVIISAAVDQDNPKKKNTHIVELTKEQMKELLSDVKDYL